VRCGISLLGLALLALLGTGCSDKQDKDGPLVAVHRDADRSCVSGEDVTCFGVGGPIVVAGPPGRFVLMWSEDLEPPLGGPELAQEIDGRTGRPLSTPVTVSAAAHTNPAGIAYNAARREYLVASEQRDATGTRLTALRLQRLGLDLWAHGKATTIDLGGAAFQGLTCGPRGGRCLLLGLDTRLAPVGHSRPEYAVAAVIQPDGHELARVRWPVGDDDHARAAGLATAYDPNRGRFLVVTSSTVPGVEAERTMAARTVNPDPVELGPPHDVGAVGQLAQGVQLALGYDTQAQRFLAAWPVTVGPGERAAVLARALDAEGRPLGQSPFVLTGEVPPEPPTLPFPRLQAGRAGLVFDWRPNAGVSRIAVVSADSRRPVTGVDAVADQPRGARTIAVGVDRSSDRALVVWDRAGAVVNTDLLARVVPVR
jgi:hypothetical protein